MAVDDKRMITFEYAKATLDIYKKMTIPDTKECMTKSDINTYLNASPTQISGYANNQLVPRERFVGVTTGMLPANLSYRFNNRTVTGLEEHQLCFNVESNGVPCYNALRTTDAISVSHSGSSGFTITATSNLFNRVFDHISTLTGLAKNQLTVTRGNIITLGYPTVDDLDIVTDVTISGTTYTQTLNSFWSNSKTTKTSLDITLNGMPRINAHTSGLFPNSNNVGYSFKLMNNFTPEVETTNCYHFDRTCSKVTGQTYKNVHFQFHNIYVDFEVFNLANNSLGSFRIYICFEDL